MTYPASGYSDQKSPSIPLYKGGGTGVPLFRKEGLGEIFRRIILPVLLVLAVLSPTLVQAITPELKAKCFPAGNAAALIHFPEFGNPDCQNYEVVLQMLIEVTNTLIEFVLAIALIFLIITGYQFVTSTGDKAGMENAKRSLLYIVIGILAVLGAFMLVKYISNQFFDTTKYKITLVDRVITTSDVWYV